MIRLAVATALAGATMALAQAPPLKQPQLPPDLHQILLRGSLRCGIDRTEAEYTTDEAHGQRTAFDDALCHAVAVAILGPKAQVQAASFPDETAAIAALRSGEVDLIPTLSADLTRTTDPSLTLTAPVLHDAVTVLAPLTANIGSPQDLAGRTVCFLAETETETALQDWSRARHIAFTPFPFQEQGEMEAAFVTGNCAAVAGDATRLGNLRASLGTHAVAYRILPQPIADDPLATAVRATDPALARIAQWTIQALLHAEAEGIDAANVATFPAGKSANADRLLGRTHEFGKPLNLRETWAQDVLQTVGNYADLFNRTLGQSSPMALPRGLNALCANGGALCPLPFK